MAQPAFSWALTAAVMALSMLVPALFGTALSWGATPRWRAGIVAALIAWMALGWGLVVAGLVDSSELGFPAFVPPIGATVLAGVMLLRWGRWRRIVDAASMQLLLVVESARVAGLLFVYMASVGALPAEFGLPVGIGDTIAGAFALAALVAWRTERRYRRGFVLVAMVVGLIDAGNALRHALEIYASAPVLGRFPFALLLVSAVPLLVLTHIYVLFKLLFGTRSRVSFADPGPSRPGFDAPGQDRRKLQVGALAPPIEGEGLDGRPVTLSALRGKWVLVSFHRYAACPVCNVTIRDYVRRHQDVRSAGLEVLAVFHSPRQRLLEYLPSTPRDITIIADPGMVLYERYGAGARVRSLLDPRTLFMGVQSVGVGSFNPLQADGPAHSVPSEFVIDPAGRVRHLRHGAYPGDVMSVDEVLTLIAALRRVEQTRRSEALAHAQPA